jgi:hypothetical protein
MQPGAPRLSPSPQVASARLRERRGEIARRCSASAPCFSNDPAKTAVPPPSRSTGCWIGTRVPPSWVTPSIGGVQIAPRVQTIGFVLRGEG